MKLLKWIVFDRITAFGNKSSTYRAISRKLAPQTRQLLPQARLSRLPRHHHQQQCQLRQCYPLSRRCIHPPMPHSAHPQVR